MKTFLIALIACVFLTQPAKADGEKLLGAIAGGVLGSSVGDGDGRKAATVLGAVLGYRYGDRILNTNANDPTISYYNYNTVSRDQSKMRAFCKNNVPAKYRISDSVANSWINGCMAKLVEEQRQLEEEAFQDALNR